MREPYSKTDFEEVAERKVWSAMSEWNVTKCESCGKKATKCCTLDNQPMLWFCAKCFKRHVLGAHGGTQVSETQTPYNFTFSQAKNAWICSVHGLIDHAAWVPCWNGCEDGYFDAYEDDPINCDEGEMEMCRECKGNGGFSICPECNLNNPDAEF